MNVEDLKRWHWMLLGIVAGALFGGVRLLAGPAFVSDVEAQTVMQGEFEWAACGLSHASASQLLGIGHSAGPRTPSLAGVTVHPHLDVDPPGTLWVTGEILSTASVAERSADGLDRVARADVWRPFRYRAASPYTAYAGVPGTYPTVLDYLRAVGQSGTADLAYHYGWWERPAWTMSLYTGAGFIAIGVVWPAALGLLMRAGLGRPAPAERPVKLSSGKAPVAQGPAVPAGVDWEQFEAAADGIATPADAPDAATKPRAAPVTPLPTVAPEAGHDEAPAATADPEYRGEFYPVAKT